MKKIILGLFIVGAFASATIIQNSEGRSIPAADVKTLDGKTVNTSKFSNDGKPMIIDFWATWCKPCKKELDAISEVYAEWQKETGVKLIAISIDDSRSSGKVSADAKTHGWEYEVYLDENQDFKRALNVGDIPQVFILNGKGEIVWQHNGYVDGGEEHIFEVLKKVAKGEKITE
ncbi:MAG: alkyl hydroperoxide reductase [Bacteroidetes bacterium RIFCSPLOWO2_12_FULL_35_15]|nr:MAG: alkyl hydroperoxide reductase [Bacteroidetes bacterium RIFCSPLOWO2_12_FULL_35_15]